MAFVNKTREFEEMRERNRSANLEILQYLNKKLDVLSGIETLYERINRTIAYGKILGHERNKVFFPTMLDIERKEDDVLVSLRITQFEWSDDGEMASYRITLSDGA